MEAQEYKPVVSVVIPHHTGTLIHRCLESLTKQEGVTPQIIVVTSDTNFRTLDYHIEQLFSTDGPAGKRNFGVRFAKSRFIAFLDDDVEISPFCLYEMWACLKDNPKVGMCYAKILNMERRKEFDDAGSYLTCTGFLWARAENGVEDTGQFDEPCEILASKSATCMVRRGAFFEAGGFDKDYFILGEETDLSWRMWLKGWRVLYWPQAVSWHAFNTSLKPKPKFYTDERIFYRGCHNYINLLLTNLGTRRLLCTLPLHISVWLVSAVGFALRGEWRRSWLILRGIWANFTGWRVILAKRRRVQSSRGVSDRILMQTISRSPRFRYYTDRMRRYLSQGIHG
mgnify:CR=1 FL=1